MTQFWRRDIIRKLFIEQVGRRRRGDWVAVLVALGLVVALVSPASAVQRLVNVDVFGPSGSGPNSGDAFSGAGVLGSAGDLWNELGTSQSWQTCAVNLKDSAGNLTGVSISCSGVGGYWGDFGGGAATTDSTTKGLLADYLNANNGTITVQLMGLLPNSPYNLVVYSCGDQVNQNATLSGAINYAMGPCSRGAFQLGANYAQNISAMSDANGKLSVSLSGSGWVAFNGLQVLGNIPLGRTWNFPNGHLQFKGTNFFLIGIYDYPTETSSNAQQEKVNNMSNYCQYANTVEFFDHNCGWNNGFVTYLNPQVLQTANNWGLAVADDMWTFSTDTNASPNGNWLNAPAELTVGSDWYNRMQLLNPYSGVNTQGPLGWTNNGALLMYGQVDESTGNGGTAQYPTLNQFNNDYSFYHSYGSVPVWYNCGAALPSGLTIPQVQPWANACDVFSMDVYAGEPENNLYVRQNMDFMRAMVGVNKPALMVLEAVGYYADIYTYTDKANQVYSAIVHGASGIWWYGAAGQAGGGGLDPNSTQWQDVIKISRQLKTMHEALANCIRTVCRYYNTQTSQQITSGISASGDSNQIEMLKASDGVKDYLICVNTSQNNVSVNINGVLGWRGGAHLYNFTGGADTTMGSPIAFAPAQVIIYQSTNTAASGPVANGAYKVININSGQALSVNNGNLTVGYNLSQMPDTGAPWQQWVFTSIGGNEYTIVNANSWQNLDVSGWSLVPGGLIHQFVPTGAANQTWKLLPNGDGSYTIQSKESTLLMEVVSASTANGAGIDQCNMTGPGGTAPAAHQKWNLVPVAASEVNVDVFGPSSGGPSGGAAFSGPGVLGGGFWNELGDAQNWATSASNLLNSAGSVTGVGIQVSGSGGLGYWGNLGGGAPTTYAATQGLLGDYLNANNGTITVQVTGLWPKSPYNLVVYSCGDQTNQNATMTGAINCQMGPCIRGAFQLGANYAQNTNAVSDANGRLIVALSNSGFVAFNGLQIFGNIPPVGYLNAQAGPNHTITLTWSSAATGFTLQTSTNISGPWNASSLTPVLQNGQYVVTNTAAAGAMFYRLVH